MKKSLSYIPLKTHSDYSLLQSTLKIKDLVQYALDEQLPAIGLCDNANLFGALEFSQSCAAQGIQPITAINIPIHYKEIKTTVNNLPLGFLPHLTLLCLNETGYKNLIELSSRVYDNLYEKKQQSIDIEDIWQNSAGIALLSGGEHGLINFLLSSNKIKIASEILTEAKKQFGDRCYIEIQRHGLEKEKYTEAYLLQIAEELGLPIIATQEPYFKKPQDIEAHRTLVAIRRSVSVDNIQNYEFTSRHCLQAIDNIKATYHDISEAIENTLELAKRIEFRPKKQPPALPRFTDTKNNEKIKEKHLLRQKTVDGINQKIKKYGKAKKFNEGDYHNRIDFELSIIDNMNYNGYFLIVADFINWARQNDIPVGPGRGSGAGSLVAYALNITSIDPLKFGLIFERFLNPGRLSMPDFDIDICQTKREKVINYVRDKYGEQAVAQIITFGKLQARAVLRDVGRAMNIPYRHVDDICKKIPYNPASPPELADVLNNNSYLADKSKNDPRITKLFEISLKLEGLYRHCSTHAAGIVIAHENIRNIVPIYKDEKSNYNITQFSMQWVEQAGLVKFDLLGLKTLSIIEAAQQRLRDKGYQIDFDNIQLDDAKTFEIFFNGDTSGVFQFESTGMREALKQLKPDEFEDLIALVSLYRPGPMDNLPSYIARKNGAEKIEYLHPLVEKTLKPTYGIMIYQEQVIETARILAGFSLADADLLRRAMGKKIRKDMQVQKKRFIKGAQKNNIKSKQASVIFDLIEKFAGYGFNKSHAAAYAMIAYQTAYLKAHYPIDFCATLLDFEIHNTDKLGIFVNDAKRAKISVLPPCINHSECYFKAETNSIRYSIAAIKNVGLQIAEFIEDERKKNGVFTDISDFLWRVGNHRHINKKSLENLIKSGALDVLHKNRLQLLASTEIMLGYAVARQKRKQSQQDELFNGDLEIIQQDKVQLIEVESKTDMLQRLHQEKESLGFYLMVHPVSMYRKDKFIELARIKNEEKNIDHENCQSKNLLVMVSSLREKKSQKGNNYGFIEFSDESGEMEAIVFSDTLDKHRELLLPGKIIVIRITGEARENGEWRSRLINAEKIDCSAKTNRLRHLMIKLRRQDDALPELVETLRQAQIDNRPQDAALYANATLITIIVPTKSQNCDTVIELNDRYVLNVLQLKNLEDIVENVKPSYY